MKVIEINNGNINNPFINELFYKNNCFVGVFNNYIHCQNMKPEWNKLKKKLKNK